MYRAERLSSAYLKGVYKLTMTIKEARKQAGLTQQAVSDMLGIPKRNIENWEGGKRKCPEWCERLIVDKILQIAKEQN